MQVLVPNVAFPFVAAKSDPPFSISSTKRNLISSCQLDRSFLVHTALKNIKKMNGCGKRSIATDFPPARVPLLSSTVNYYPSYITVVEGWEREMKQFIRLNYDRDHPAKFVVIITIINLSPEFFYSSAC
jgi:hypothetical protein